LLEGAGLRDITARTYTIDTKEESRGIIRRYGCLGIGRILLRTLGLYASSPAYRRFVKGIKEAGILPENLHEYFGYGVYVGRK
jgi:hypothetical protein